MAGQLLTIRCLKDIEHADGSPRWRKGSKVHLPDKELAERNLPRDSYEVVGGGVNRQDAEIAKADQKAEPGKKV